MNILTRKISIHAPPRGATDGERVRFAAWCYFNSRPSARGDACATPHAIAVAAISIHAPPRGATLAKGEKQTYTIISIHAPPRGAT